MARNNSNRRQQREQENTRRCLTGSINSVYSRELLLIGGSASPVVISSITSVADPALASASGPAIERSASPVAISSIPSALHPRLSLVDRLLSGFSTDSSSSRQHL